MDYQLIDSYLDTHMPELLDDLRRLIAIDSERTDAAEGCPFGRGAKEVLDEAAAILAEDGFAVRNYDNYVVTADFSEEREAGLDILAHLDVVPAGDGWTVTDPFVMKVVDDKVYGRGSVDDKGPALCALYAMKAIRECGYPLKKNVRLILGSDEECGSGDIAYYYAREKAAPMSISPDADYPVINREMGRLQSGFSASCPIPEEMPRLIRFKAGVKTNVVPDKASAVFEGLTAGDVQPVMDRIALKTGCRFEAGASKSEKDGLIINAFGSTAHGSAPSHGINALTGLVELIASLPLSGAPLHQAFQSLATLFPHGDFKGEAIGAAMKDELSETSMALTILSYSQENGLSGQFDCRACLKATDKTLTDVVYGRLRACGFEPAPVTMVKPHIVDSDSFLVKTLLDLYNGMTGRNDKPLCIGGGTYVHDIEGGVAFGVCTDDIDNHMHSADEFITLDQLSFGCRIYARAILELCG